MLAAAAGLVLAALAVALYAGSAANRRRDEQAALVLRTSDTASLVFAVVAQGEAALTSSRLAAIAARGDGARFRALARAQVNLKRAFLNSVTLIRLRGLTGTVVQTVGGRAPTFLSHFGPDEWAALRGLRGPRPQVVAVDASNGAKLLGVGLAVDPARHEVLYAEIDTSWIVSHAFPSTAQLAGALYVGGVESPLTLIAASTSELPVRGHRKTFTGTLYGQKTLLVVGLRGPLVTGILARSPEYVLVLGLLLAVLAGGGTYALLRRRDEALERADALVARNAELDSLAQRLSASERRFRELFEDANDIVLTVDGARLVTAINRAGERATGRFREEIVGRPLAEFVVPDDLPRLDEHLEHELGGHGTGSLLEVRLVAIEDRIATLELSTRPILAGRTVEGVQVIARDVTERLAFQHELSRQAFYDQLTGLANRALLFDRIDHALVAAPSPESVAVLVIDLDDFKTVNDSLGHGAGDVLLGDVAVRLRAQLRPADTCARLGGDEFAVLLEGLGAPEEATAVADTLLAALEEPFALPGREAFIRASVGIVIGRPGAGPTDLLRDADIAMYRAKSSPTGRGWEMFRPEMLDVVTYRLALTAELNRAVERRELEVHYQPIVELATGAVQGLEALVRWQHPARGLLPPGLFIGLAEETGLIVPIGQIVLEEACAEVLSRSVDGRELEVSVNVSGRQLQERGFVDSVARALVATGLRAQRLTLEITESVLLQEAGVASTLIELRNLGVRLAIDDFGSGYSSLDYLRRYPVDVLKVDRSFVRGISNERDIHFLQAIVQLAESLGLETVAEGIETEAHQQHAKLVRCSHGQGFFFGHPVPPADLDDLLAGPPRDLRLAG